jgi:diguanylate cyclase (GGDEF)-like protein/PAS domain S-box-containing protein
MFEEFEKSIDLSPDPTAVLSLDGKFRLINRAFSNILGWDKAELIAKDFSEIIIPDQTVSLSNIHQKLLKGHPVFFINSYGKGKDSSVSQLYWTAYPDLTAETITVVLRTSNSLGKKDEWAIMAADASPTVILVVSPKGEIHYANAFVKTMFGYSKEELIGQPVETLLPFRLRASHQEHRRMFEQEPYLRLMGTTPDLTGLHKDGSEFPVDVGLNPVQTMDGLAVVCSIVDMTKREETETAIVKKIQNLEFKITKLDKLSNTDALTEVKNRRAMDIQLELHYRIAQTKGEPISFLLLDIDNFKHYNDSFGHLAGDEVLKYISKILTTNLRRSEIIARYGGEEFGIILPGDNVTDAMRTAERLRKTIEEFECPFQRITVSIGCTTVFPKIGVGAEPDDAINLIRMADQALYYSKRNGRNRVIHFDQLVLSPEEKLNEWKFRFDQPFDK